VDSTLGAFVSYVVVTSFTPGPNNISSASMGVLYGYRRTLQYLLGIAAGFAMVMVLCGLISTTLLELLPAFEGILRWVGVAYILWLAYETWRASYQFEDSGQTLLGFSRGLWLQALNPKVIVYGLTLYASWPDLVAGSWQRLSTSALFLAFVAFASTSTWALAGAAIRSQLRRPGVRRWVSAILSLLLVWTALELSGILGSMG